MRFFVNKGENYVKNCHHRIQDNSEVLVEEDIETKHNLNNRYFQFTIGHLLQKIDSSLYWRYGMSLVISLEPNPSNPHMPFDDTFPMEPNLWGFPTNHQPGGYTLLYQIFAETISDLFHVHTYL